MPRRRKATSSKAKAASATTTRSGRKSTLSLKTNNANLTLETTDSNLVSNILAQFDVTPSGGAAKAAAPKKRGRRPGRPAKAGRKPAAKKAAAPVPSLKLSKTAISAAMKGANPTNHEQRILALAKIAKKSGAKEITTKDIETYASATGISQSTIPGSLSKLRGRKHLSVRKDGRRAFYSLTAAGESEADKVLSGKAKAARRGRKSSGKTAAKKTTAKKRGPAKKTAAKKTTARKAKPGPKPGAKRGRKPGPKPGAKRGRKPGPKPGAGRKKTTAAAKKSPQVAPRKPVAQRRRVRSTQRKRSRQKS
jgi:histone H1/5